MNKTNVLIKMYESLPENLRPFFMEIQQEEDKAIVNEYIEALKHEDVLEKDKISQIDNSFAGIGSKLHEVALLCEYGLKEDYEYWFKETYFDSKVSKLSSYYLKDYKIDNPVINEIKTFLNKIDNVFKNIYNSVEVKDTNSISKEENYRIKKFETKEEIQKLYTEFKENLSKIPFAENKLSYVEAGVCLTERYPKNKAPEVCFTFPLLLAETYRNNSSENTQDFKFSDSLILSKVACSKEDYLEINSKIDLFGRDNYKRSKIESILDVSKLDKIKYELQKENLIKNTEHFNKGVEDKKNNDTAVDSSLKHHDKTDKTDSKYDDKNENKEEYEDLKDNYDDYYDSVE